MVGKPIETKLQFAAQESSSAFQGVDRDRNVDAARRADQSQGIGNTLVRWIGLLVRCHCVSHPIRTQMRGRHAHRDRSQYSGGASSEARSGLPMERTGVTAATPLRTGCGRSDVAKLPGLRLDQTAA
jgi:hypothetical protein